MCLFVATVGNPAGLPNGYRIEKIPGGLVCINGEGEGEVVEWEVKKYGVSGEFVLGYAAAVTDRHPAGDVNSKGGWFFLDTKTHEVWEHLTKTEMRIRALKNGVYWIPWMKTVGFVPRKFLW